MQSPLEGSTTKAGVVSGQKCFDCRGMCEVYQLLNLTHPPSRFRRDTSFKGGIIFYYFNKLRIISLDFTSNNVSKAINSMECPVCKTDSEINTEKEYGRYWEVNCPRCGRFNWEKEIERGIPNYQQNKIILSYWIRTNQNKTEIIHLDEKLVEAIIRDTKPLSVNEKANKLLLLIGSDLKRPDERIILDSKKKFEYLAKVSAEDENELSYLIEFLKSVNWLKTDINFFPEVENKIYEGFVLLTFLGWERFENLSQGKNYNRAAFMAMDFNDDKIEKAYQECFKPSIALTGFELFNLREKPKAGLIDNRLRAEIRNSRFLLADLTNSNLGAYWEAGFAEGLGKPVIYLCEKSHFEKFKTHFDTNHHYTVIYDMKDLENASENLVATIRATLPSEVK